MYNSLRIMGKGSLFHVLLLTACIYAEADLCVVTVMNNDEDIRCSRDIVNSLPTFRCQSLAESERRTRNVLMGYTNLCSQVCGRWDQIHYIDVVVSPL